MAREKAKIRLEELDIEVAKLRRKVEKLTSRCENYQSSITEMENGILFLEESLEKFELEQTPPLQEDEEPEMEMNEADFNLMKNRDKYAQLILQTADEFDKLLSETESKIQETTFRGGVRTRTQVSVNFKPVKCYFSTLFWLANYPTYQFMSVLFGIHERTLVQILKRVIHALSETLKGEIKFPSDDEFDKLKDEFNSFKMEASKMYVVSLMARK